MIEKNITKSELKKFYVNYHGFYDLYNNNENDVMKVFDRISSIQYDPIDIIGRNADLVLFSRIKDYQKEDINKYLYDKKELVDGWDKQMGIYPSKYFNNYSYIRKYTTEDMFKYIQRSELDKYIDEINKVIEYMKHNGQITQNGLKDIGIEKIIGKYNHKLSVVICDYLLHSGVIGVENKKGVVKYYNLIENIFGNPFVKEPDFKTEEEFLMWYLKRRIKNVGAIWNKSGGGWLGPIVSNKIKRTNTINELLDKKEIIKLNVEEIKEPLYICKEDEIFFDDMKLEKRAIFIAPLDSFIWDRALIKEVFNFDYVWEVYMKEENRKYGYYCLPVVIGCDFVGRFQPLNTNEGDKFSIFDFWWGNKEFKTLENIELILDEFDRLSKFLKCSGINKTEIKKILKSKS